VTKIYSQKLKAEVDLMNILYKIYSKKDFHILEYTIKEYMSNAIYKHLEIKERYIVFKRIYNYIWELFEKKYIPSLKKIDTALILHRAEVDANLLIQTPANILDGIHFAKQKLQKKSEEDTEDAYLFLFWLSSLEEGDLLDEDAIKRANQKTKKAINDAVDEGDLELAEALREELIRVNPAVVATAGYQSIVKLFSKDKWNSQFLETSRPAHMQANGQRRGADGYFVVGGEELRYPGDFDNGSVANVINCRCFITRDVL
jgi:hypothetical protein